QFGSLRLLPDAGGIGRSRAATAHAPDLAVAGVPAGYSDRPVTGLPGRALAERRARRRDTGSLGLRGEPDAGAMAHADARAAGAGLVARPARQPGIAGRLHGLGAAWRYGVVSLPALRLEAGGWRLEAGGWTAFSAFIGFCASSAHSPCNRSSRV